MRTITDFSVVSNDGGTVLVVDAASPGGSDRVDRVAADALQFVQDGKVIAVMRVPADCRMPLLGVCEMDAEAGVLVREHPFKS